MIDSDPFKLFYTVEPHEILIHVFANMEDGLIVLNDLGRIVLANTSARNIFGYEKDELLGLKVENLVPPESRNTHGVARNNFITSGTLMRHGREFPGYTKAGHIVQLLISISSFKFLEERFYTAVVIKVGQE